MISRLQFPKADFQSKPDSLAPINLQWSVYSPIIPYDHDASCLPAVIIHAEIENTTATPLVCAITFNQDLDDDADMTPTDTILAPVHLSLKDINSPIIHDIAGVIESTNRSTTPNGLLLSRQARDNSSHRQYCIAVHTKGNDAAESLWAWDTEKEEEYQQFSQAITAQGILPRSLQNHNVRCLTACSRIAIDPGQRQTVLFVSTWHDSSNRTTMRLWRDAAEAARHALLHEEYLQAAVQEWHARIGSISPKWLSNTLFTAIECFITQGRLSAVNTFEWAITGTEPQTLQSLGLLLFYPRFQARNLLTRLKTASPPPKAVERYDYIIETYRDFLFTGNHTHVEQAYHTLSEWLDQTPVDAEENGKTMGMRLSAQRAMAHMAQIARDGAGLDRWLSACRKDRQLFEDRFWCEEKQQYIDPASSDEDPTDILSGPCCAAWLHMDDLLHMDNLTATLNTLDSGLLPMRLPTIALLRLAILEQSLSLSDIPNGRWIPRLGARMQNSTDIDIRLFWALFIASTGFVYAVANQRLVIAPAPSVGELETTIPLMLPLCFGHLRYRETPSNQPYEARIYLTLDSPIMVREIAVRLPARIPGAKALCTHDHETLPSTTQIWKGTGIHHLTITLTTPLRLTGIFRIYLREQAPPTPEVPPKKGWRR